MKVIIADCLVYNIRFKFCYHYININKYIDEEQNYKETIFVFYPIIISVLTFVNIQIFHQTPRM